MDSGPIFIGGLAHSGKTPLRLMLSSHPNLAFTRRTYMWRRFYERYGDLHEPANFEHCLDAMLAHKHMHALQPDPERIRREFSEGPATYARLFALFHQHNAERLGCKRWGDQLGFVERYAGVIFAAYPGARLIHMVRDPRARYAALITRNRVRQGKAGAETARWIASVRLGMSNRKQFPDQYKMVRYETLVSQPEETLKAICAFIGEDFVSAMLPAEDTTRYGGDPNAREDHALGSGWLTAATDGEFWRRIPQPVLAFIQAHARNEMRAFNYPQESIRFSLHDLLRYGLIEWPANRLGMAAWSLLDANASQARSWEQRNAAKLRRLPRQLKKLSEYPVVSPGSIPAKLFAVENLRPDSKEKNNAS